MFPNYPLGLDANNTQYQVNNTQYQVAKLTSSTREITYPHIQLSKSSLSRNYHSILDSFGAVELHIVNTPSETCQISLAVANSEMLTLIHLDSPPRGAINYSTYPASGVTYDHYFIGSSQFLSIPLIGSGFAGFEPYSQTTNRNEVKTTGIVDVCQKGEEWRSTSG